MEYRFLTDDDIEIAHTTFLEAFADYLVSVQPSKAQFERHLTKEGVRLEMSVGTFVGDEMGGILLNAIDDWQGQATAYDAGTGVIPKYRGQGAASGMLSFALPTLKENGIKQCLLEVIQENEPAIKVYSRLGFETTRTLECVRLTPDNVSINVPADSEIEIKPLSTPNWAYLQTFWDWQPAWQNSIGSINRSAAEFELLGAFLGDECMGYAAVSTVSGGLAQIAVARAARGQGIGSQLVAACRAKIGEDRPMSMINIDGAAEDTLDFLAACGFEKTVTQYEMCLAL